MNIKVRLHFFIGIVFFVGIILMLTSPKSWFHPNKSTKMALRYQQEYQRTKDPHTQTVPRQRLLKARQYQRSLSASRGGAGGLEWTERGPSNVGGRTRAILWDKRDTSFQTVWAGGVAGGLWKTEQFDASEPEWIPINDFFDNMAVACIIQHPYHLDTILFGTGEGWFNGDAMRGMGIWLTTDGGQSWNPIPQTLNPDFYYTQKLAFDSLGNLYAATRNKGVMCSEDLGQTWTQVLGSGVGQGSTNRAADIEVGANGDIFASLGIFSTGSIFKSSYADHGTDVGKPGTWQEITPTGNFERIEIAVAPSDPGTLYFVAQGAGINQAEGAYRSDNGGASWSTLPIPFLGNQVWYDLIMQVDPLNEDILYLGGIESYRSMNGGQNWKKLNGFHVDHHAILIHPKTPEKGIWGTDGGLYVCENLWSNNPGFYSKNEGYHVTQFYSVAMHPQQNRNEFIGGTQDNGSRQFLYEGMNETTVVTGGDGGYCHIDQDESDIQITSFIFNQYYITTDSWETREYLSFGFQAGLFINPTDYDDVANTLYAAYTPGRYLRLADIPNCLEVGCEESVSVYGFSGGQVTHVAISPFTTHTVYFGLDNNRIVKVEQANQGLSKSGQWINQGINLPDSVSVSCIAFNPENEDHLIVTYSNYGIESIWETTDGGNSWMSIENNLPDMPVRWAIFTTASEYPVLLATELGIWGAASLDGSNTFWQPLSDGLANTRIDMLQYRPSDKNIIAATHGRGMFTTDYFEELTIQFGESVRDISESEIAGYLGNCGEEQMEISILLELSKAPEQATEVSIQVNAQSDAQEGKDFSLPDTSFVFVPDSALVKTIPIILYDGGLAEGSRELILDIQLSDTLSPLAIGDTTQFVLTLKDDEVEPMTGVYDFTGQIGAGGTNQPYAPFRGSYEDQRTQLLILAEELKEAGFGAGNVEGLSFFIEQKGSNGLFQNLNIQLKNTTATSTAGDFETGGTPVFWGDVETNYGWNTFTFNYPFFWDGASNVLIDLCYNNNTPIGDDILKATTTDFVSVSYKRGHLGSGCSFLSPSHYSTSRPDIRLVNKQSPQVETSLGDSISYPLAAGETIYFYSGDRQIVAAVERLDNGDPVCIAASIVNEGEGQLQPVWLAPDAMSQKVFQLSADGGGSYEVSLFFTQEELAAWGAEHMELGVLRLDSMDIDNPSGLQIIDETAVDAQYFGLDQQIVYRFQTDELGVFALTSASASILPVKEFRLSGIRNKGDVELEWSWEGTPVPAEFVVERAVSDGFFQSVGNHRVEVPSAILHVEFSDRDAPEEGLYYRIKSINDLGKYVYSNNIHIEPTYSQQYTLFPNPTSGQLRIKGEFPYRNLSVNLYALTGEQIEGIEWVKNGNIMQVDFSQLNLAEGVYVLEVLYKGKALLSETLVYRSLNK